MGEFATAVQERLRERLRERRPAYDWETEVYVAGTPVDLAGEQSGRRVLVELEWRRADPADNTAKLFRHLASGELDSREVLVVQVFSAYYDLASGGVSSKRENAEFVGTTAAEAFDRLTYRPLDLAIDPPKRGGEWPSDWKRAVDEIAGEIAELLD
jgi:hypothetical protein